VVAALGMAAGLLVLNVVFGGGADAGFVYSVVMMTVSVGALAVVLAAAFGMALRRLFGGARRERAAAELS
jgi:hypothetical protein